MLKTQFGSSEVVLTTAARLLKERTADIHTRVESNLDLLDPGLDEARLREVVGHLHAFWAGSEPLLDEWADTHPARAAELDWTRRRRTDRLAADLVRLGGSPLDPAPVVFDGATSALPDDAAVFGWLYVAEGSTLGGAVINRMLGRLPGSVRVDSFMPYAEGPGPMWLAFVRLLEQWTSGDELRAERVAAAGVQTFAALETWIAPLAKDVAA